VSETSRQRFDRLIREAMARADRVVEVMAQRLVDGLLAHPIPDDKIATLVLKSDDDLRQRLRKLIEPKVRDGLAHVRPN